MFIKCKLLLSQGGNSAEIILERVTGSAFAEGASFWGPYTSIGGNIPPERRQWLFALTKWECRLMDAGGPGVGMVGGGSGYGDLEPVPPAAILSMAAMTDRGIEPVNRGGSASGRIDDGFAIDISFHRGPITWTLAGFQRPGSNVWQSP